MVDIKEKTACSGCWACASSCPKQCIRMVSDEEGFLYPTIDKEKCVDCSICDNICPIINPSKTNNEPVAYAAYNKDEDIRLNSSSGGVFTLIAEYVIDMNGVVFGAAFDEEFTVKHTYVENKADLYKLRGSKYVQSKIDDAYKKAKIFLDTGRTVFFGGTPCQIAGLYSYLKKDYDNLVTHDLICHGVPSDKLWKKYLGYQAKKYKSKLKSASFRDKAYGWKEFCMKLEYENGKKYVKKLFDDLYMRAFLTNIDLRPACYNCAFKTKIRCSDFTLADFLGIQKVLPEMDFDDKGTSLIVVNSKKGREIFGAISNNLEFLEVDIDTATKYNRYITESVKRPASRNKYMEMMQIKSFKKVSNVFVPNTFLGKCIKKLRKIFGK